jgi:hypothetical protein
LSFTAISISCSEPRYRSVTPGKDSCRIVTDAPALALEVSQDPSSLPLLAGFELKLGQLIAAEGATDQKRKHDLVALAFQATPNSAGVGSEVVRNAVKRVFCSIAPNAGQRRT